MALACTVTPTATPTPPSPMYSKKEAIAVVKEHLQASAFCELTGFSCANPRQSHTFQGMGFHYRFSRGDRVQIISGKHKGARHRGLKCIPVERRLPYRPYALPSCVAGQRFGDYHQR